MVFSLSCNLFAQEIPVANETAADTVAENVYSNFRESASMLITDQNRDEVKKIYSGTKSLEILNKILADKNINRCATKIVAAIENQLDLRNDIETGKAILGLRLNESIDDVSASILNKANMLSRPLALPFAKDNLSSEEEEKALKIFATQAKDIKNKTLCMEDSWRSLVSKLASSSPKYVASLKHVNKIAHDENLINDSEFKTLEMMRVRKVHEWPLTLAMYGDSLESIAKKFPSRTKEESDLMTDKTAGKFNHKTSLRQSLFERYNSTQIILLAGMAKELKERLVAKDITIVINYVDQQTEVINLSPMEKFRFIIKILRKELSLINNGTLLNGFPASYLDIITASYEVGYVSAAEIKQLVSLENIWNPKIATKQKVIAWGERFGGIASVFLPPPFGFASLMAIMLIDQYSSPIQINRDVDYNIF
jgi:hypothetical protein